MRQNKHWPVSTTGGEKISGQEAARILGVSYTTIHNLIKRDRLRRAEKYNPTLINQPVKLFLADVLALKAEAEETPANDQPAAPADELIAASAAAA